MQLEYFKYVVVVRAVLNTFQAKLPGSMMVFVSGGDECEKLVDLINTEAQKDKDLNENRVLEAVPLYAGNLLVYSILQFTRNNDCI